MLNIEDSMAKQKKNENKKKHIYVDNNQLMLPDPEEKLRNLE